MLQLQDGSFAGTLEEGTGGISNGQITMAGFDSSGNIRWTVPNDQPQIATDDGGVIGKSGVKYDSNGSAVGQTTPLPTISWNEDAYLISPLMQIAFPIPQQATPFYWSFAQAGQAPNSASPICRDDRDQLIHEYSTYNAGFTPFCSDFTPSSNSQPSPHFSFSQLDVSDISRNEFPDWAILLTAMLNGLENTLTNYNNQSIAIGSGYRSPKVQNIINPRAPRDRHIHGDAADLATGNSQTTWNDLHSAAHNASACIEPQKLSTVNHVHADWRQKDGTPCPQAWLR
jgi:hypothetical protein